LTVVPADQITIGRAGEPATAERISVISRCACGRCRDRAGVGVAGSGVTFVAGLGSPIGRP
jgi:hypothetical protein